ncbi:pilus assembly protein TadG-related protein [Mangrovibrevibacter kandeliae]|uniref:pilus assembly protein TadG-related protein n=1 Tax=Mangrovibrevibacter kandeliae TaxID=2968473 RepID=UPI0027404E8B|nr:pilus assembly protein TadG-related protein [Aurantimonas sp. CSK15Z-1]
MQPCEHHSELTVPLYDQRAQTWAGWLMLRRYIRSRSGNFAIISSILMVPLIFSVGAAIDLARQYTAHSHLQDLADDTALALAASNQTDLGALQAMAARYVGANEAANSVRNVALTSLDVTDKQVQIGLHGDMPTAFMSLAHYPTLDVDVNAVAVRQNASVEVALVLDNTWSMSKQINGQSKLDILKDSARDLVGSVLIDGASNVKVALVPYADYVNIGLQYRGASWLNLPADGERPSSEVCEMIDGRQACHANAPTYSCTTMIDGVVTPSTCGGQCTDVEYIQYDTPQEVCHQIPAVKWFGCVGSRIQGNDRLNDSAPYSPYPAMVATGQQCPNPLVPLTQDKSKLLDAVDSMIISIGGYKPDTYIPAGLIWGLNALSPSEPLSEGKAYDAANKDPHKILVLMTDGDNTMQFDGTDGTHDKIDLEAPGAATRVAQTNADTAQICSYIKSKGIEIYTVTFLVDNAAAHNLLDGCATDSAHYYDASDREALHSAFNKIAFDISRVRLAQ